MNFSNKIILFFCAFIPTIFWLFWLASIGMPQNLYPSQSNIDVSNFEKRIAIVREMLSPDIPVGFIVDHPLIDKVGTYEIIKNWYLSQYVLTPVIIKYGRTSQWILGVTLDEKAFPAVSNLIGWETIKEFERGIAVIRCINKSEGLDIKD
jgi:hypothetical protein